MTRSVGIQCKADRFTVERVAFHVKGAEHERDVIRHPGSVVIVPRFDDGRVCLIRNYRVSVDQTLIELPAGTLEGGEPPMQAAYRELQEETGLIADVMIPICSFYAAPGILDEQMHLFLAESLHRGPTAREAAEEIENMFVPWSEAMAMVEERKIIDAKTIVGLFLCHDRR